MTDQQTWILVNTPDDVADRDLAAALGLTESAVHARRWTLRTKGWTCRVRYLECLHCGELVTLSGSERPRSDRPYHPACAVAAMKEQRRAIIAAREDLRKRLYQRGLEYQRECQEQSIRTAVNRGARWTESEDAWLAEHLHLPIRELAEELGRTFAGVAARKRMLRKLMAGVR